MSRLLAVALIIAAPSLACADDWASGLFDTIDHNFGKVRHGIKQSKAFSVTNNTDQTVNIRNVSVSCGCVETKLDSNTLKPGDSTRLVAYMDTSKFYGDKSVTVYVDFDQPQYRRVELRVSASSSGDNNAVSSTVQFGIVSQGKAAEKSFYLDYPGNDRWTVSGIDSENQFFSVASKELQRSSKLVRYEIKVTLSETAPVGSIDDLFRVRTSDPNHPTMIFSVKAQIQSDLTVSPDRMRLGTLKAGESVTKTLLIKATKPFKILGFDEQKGSVHFDRTDEAKTTHLLKVKISAPAEGQAPKQIEIFTDLPGSQGKIVVPLEY